MAAGRAGAATPWPTFLVHSFDNVAMIHITERAGLTRRAFSRYFTDKRDVLVTGSEQLPAVLAPTDLAPFPALLTALTEAGELVTDERAAERRAIVQASPEPRRRPPRSSHRSAPPSSGPRSTAGQTSQNAQAPPAVSARQQAS
jgi:AcrR family transcriptional regulator